ncbi:LEAF RUST 10 DISEASE-RESISTANCE LOCUS RECEPTOR-LIKE PROTEIN KINASE-like 2.5 isoform X1 [Capsella rubella]|uniref:LEAF RUST 10 DISEASE-RESISTANCE LOCUS RECEPTOR-LIKE PROTEIN KINASE-like 2.5 isoform X1 n=1 Tax=Capsella rubella TaxID=81985 RepID=UPI000CD52CE7|nr:LEAF RUST 10 DISEASE-RESISTANCE LOCUS RECEPTOR-LIKE PROTEIN KINASE-like 2.5 isoform X1 [Capsella rubella]
MNYHPISCLLFFFQSLPCASSKQELGLCDTLFQCGNITAGFPFWGGNRHKDCGHPLLELHCDNNKTSIIISDHLYNVLHIDEISNTLRLARAELEGSFCEATFSSTTLPSELYELSSTYKSLTVFYHCDSNLSYSSSYTCPGRGLVSVSETLDYQNSCQASFPVNVPKSFGLEEKELNLTHLEKALKEGFEVKLKIDEKPCQESSSSGGTCGFDNSTLICCKESSWSSCYKLHSLDGKFLIHPSNSQIHKRCSGSFSCGNQKELFYPFWISGREDCGHPDFKLDDCSGVFAELNISSVKFRILEANYGFGIIRIARLDYMEDICPQDPIDAPFNGSILPFASNTQLLTIYSQCHEDLSHLVSINVQELACGDEIRYYVTRDIFSPLLEPMILNDFKTYCDRNVSIPESGTLNTLQLTWSRANLKKTLEYGFELRPNQDCSKCIESGGACGYNQSTSSFTCYYMKEPHNRSEVISGLSIGAKAGIVVGSISGLAILTLACLVCFIRRRRMTLNNPRKKILDDSRQQYLKALIPLKHYSYVQIKKITKSFAEVVGKGGFGTVYKGILCDGRIVAVKILKDSQGNGEDFINEVASMSKTSHVNIVNLLGFCSEGSKRAIIYEFMENGSLDKFISSKKSSIMDCGELYRIALGVARGLEYLHHGCRTRIVHFDIKPQNVLLDDNLCPKVSDFGLAKLCEKKESILSLLDTRGTIGYIAPELFSRMYGRVSHKSDVYSYGMLVLEMIGAKNKPPSEDSASNQSSIYFPEWIYKDLENQDNGRLLENGINSREEEISKKMTLVGLWCIQYCPSDRPSMDRVVEMMEGNLNALEVPPRPVFQIPVAPLQETSTISEDVSAYTEICSVNIT